MGRKTAKPPKSPFDPRRGSPAWKAAQEPEQASAASPLQAADWLVFLGFVLAVFLAYQPAWQGGPLWDDDFHITPAHLQSWNGLWRIWSESNATLQYYPLLHTVFWIEHRLWGDAVLGYHLVNIAMHALAAIMAALVLRRLKVPGAYLAAAVFALHPVQVESVAWITELKNTLSTVFYLGALAVYLRFDRTRQLRWYFAALGVFVLALLSKTVTATLPGALLVIFWWQRGRLDWKRDVLPVIPFFVLGAGAGMITAWWELEHNRCVGPEFDFTAIQRLLIASRAAWFYLWKLCWPTNLLFIYPLWQIDPRVWWQWLFPVSAIALIAALWAIRRRTRAPLAAVLYFGGTLVPVLGFFNLYTFRYSLVANHYQYLASLGIITLCCAGAAQWLEQVHLWRRPLGYGLCLGLLATLGGLTWHQCQMYTDAETLYRATITKNPQCWLAHNNLGVILKKKSRSADEPQKTRYVDEALIEFRTTLELKPDHKEAINTLAGYLAEQGQIDQAIAMFRKAIQADPGYPPSYNNLAQVLASRGQLAEAADSLRQAVRLDARYTPARHELGLVLRRQGKFADAIAQWYAVLALQPGDIDAMNELAWTLATCPEASIRNGANAVQLAQQALRLCRRPDPLVGLTLAAALAESGRFAEAEQVARQAAEVAKQQQNRLLAEQINSAIQLFQTGKPIREQQ